MTNLSDRFSMDDLRVVTRELKTVGAVLATWYDAVRYEGDPLACSFELCCRKGLLKRETIALGTDERSLDCLRFYIEHNPQSPWMRLEVRRSEGQVERGCFMIVERRGFKCQEVLPARTVVKALGHDDADVDLLFSWVEETTLGYLLTYDETTARRLASVVEVGALSPGSTGEVVSLLESFAQVAQEKAALGDADGEWQAGVWSKLAHHWRRK
jgi:hypothetical protein